MGYFLRVLIVLVYVLFFRTTLSAQELKGDWKYRSFYTKLDNFWGEKDLTLSEWAPIGILAIEKEPDANGAFQGILKFKSGGPTLVIEGTFRNEEFRATAKVSPKTLEMTAKDMSEKGRITHAFFASVEYKLLGRTVPSTPANEGSAKAIRGLVTNSGLDLGKQPKGTVGLFSIESAK